jgi:branched-chain amino acid aminotransferase
MNVFFVFDDGSLLTPPLGTILPGITRDLIIALGERMPARACARSSTRSTSGADAASGN